MGDETKEGNDSVWGETVAFLNGRPCPLILHFAQAGNKFLLVAVRANQSFVMG
jgi:hypothetical protein